MKNTDADMKPVLMHIQWKDRRRWSAFRLNTSLYSAMPQEKEVLLADGERFEIVDVVDNYLVTDRNNIQHYITKIHLKFDI